MKTILLTMCVAASLTPMAWAQASLDPFALFASADTDKDGAVTKAEFLAARAKAFPQIDRNGDGVLTPDEFAAQAQGIQGRLMSSRLFANFDLNGDGQVTKDEFANAPAPLFDRADADHNGVVTKAELDAAR